MSRFVESRCARSGWSDRIGARRQLKGPAPAVQDLDLVAGLRGGCESSYELLVETYGGRMQAVALRILGDVEEARDVVQQSLITIFRSIRSFRGDSRLATWIHRIVVNNALMHLRSSRRSVHLPLDVALEADASLSGELTVTVPIDAESRLLTKERVSVLRSCIMTLPRTHRLVLVLREFEQMTTADTARRLQISENAVKIRLHRARRALSTLLDAARDAA